MRFRFVLASIVPLIYICITFSLPIQRILLTSIAFCVLIGLFYAYKKNPLKEMHTTDLNRYQSIKREAISRIPKQQAHRKSSVADTCYAKISTVQNMADLIRKPTLRKHVLEICDLANIVTDTICYTASDTVSASVFANSQLEELQKAVDHCFETYRCKEYPHIKRFDIMDISDINRFDTFIVSFTKQQRLIIEESKNRPR